MNLDRLLRRSREAYRTIKKSIWKPEIRYLVENERKNVIEIDSDDEFGHNNHPVSDYEKFFSNKFNDHSQYATPDTGG